MKEVVEGSYLNDNVIMGGLLSYRRRSSFLQITILYTVLLNTLTKNEICSPSYVCSFAEKRSTCDFCTCGCPLMFSSVSKTRSPSLISVGFKAKQSNLRRSGLLALDGFGGSEVIRTSTCVIAGAELSKEKKREVS